MTKRARGQRRGSAGAGDERLFALGMRQLMDGLARGQALKDLLASLVRLVEDSHPSRICSVLLVADDGDGFTPGCPSRLPPALIEALCRGTAPKKVALAHGFRSRWSRQILAEDGALLGLFDVFGLAARGPSRADASLVAQAALIASIAIQHWRTQNALLATRDRFETIAEYASNLLAVTDMDGVIRYVSPSCLPLLGFTAEELVGRNLNMGVHTDDLPRASRAYTVLREQVGTQIQGSYRYRHKDGSWRALEVTAKSRYDYRGEYIAVVSGRDVTDREIAREALEKSQSRLGAALEATGLGLWEWHVDSGRFHIDERCAAALGYTPAQIDPSYETLTAIIHPDDAMRVALATEAHLKGKADHLDYECRILTHAGTWTHVHTRGKAIRDAQGVPWRVTGTTRNVEAERAVEARLARASSQIQLLMEGTDEGVIGLDRDGTCTFVNPAAVRLLGIPVDELLGHAFDEKVRHTAEDGTDLIGHDSPIVHCLLNGQRYLGANELFWRSPAAAVPVEYTVSPLLEDGRPAGAVLVFRDVSDKRALARQLQHQALHDPLTGLSNRRGFERRLTALLASARDQRREHALCYLDLDHFKIVNDTCGHAAGDELLRQLPGLLQPLVGDLESIARLGGDEFALVLEDCPLGQAACIAERVRDAIRDFRFTWQYRTFTIGASIGVVGVTAQSGGLISVLGAADAACYVAKDQGPNHVHVSYPHDLAIIRRRGEMRWVARIKTALEEGHFRLHYMSIARLGGADAPRHHELLLRLAEPKSGRLILPSQFLPAAERYQLMPQVDRWVIENALAALGSAARREPECREHRFGINLSGESLRDARLLSFIQDALDRHAVPPSMIYFELTETAAIANLGAAIEFIRGLKALGCELALDDFGSGMSSFAYLKQLPVDMLKIDGSFVKDLLTSPVDQAIVRAVQAVGTQMNILTIAEYVETDAIAEALRQMGIHFGQGHAIALARPLEEFPAQTRSFAATA